MGRAAKLKRQRKQQRLNLSPSFTDYQEQLSPLEREIDQQISDLINWLLDQWFQVPQFLTYYTFEQAYFTAARGVYLLFDASEQKPTQDVTLAFSLKPPFTMHLFLDIQLKAIATSVSNDVEQHVFDLPGQFIL